MFRRNVLFASVLVCVPTLFAVPAGNAHASNISVTNCNDSGAGSLRNAVASAASGDTIDMAALTCRLINLTGGAINIAQHDLSLVGGPPVAMKVDAGHLSPVLRHSGSGTLYIKRMNIADGANYTTAPLGGCIYTAGNIELVDSIVHGCRARGIWKTVYAIGGGVYAKGAVKLVHSQVVDNLLVYGYDGAIFAGGGLTSFSSRICGNRMPRGGTIVFSGAGMFMRYTTFCNNRGDGIWAQGGPIVIDGSTFSGNVGDGVLGLSVKRQTWTTTILDTTISGNTSPSGTPFVGLQLNSPKSISNTTIAFNQQLNQCGPASGTVRIIGPDYPTLLDSNIVSNNSCNGAPAYAITHTLPRDAVIGANNLINGPSTLELPADTITADPRLEPLADNGGPTQTHALPTGSPAIDTGNNEAGLRFDQRGPGFPRVKASQADIGAFER